MSEFNKERKTYYNWRSLLDDDNNEEKVNYFKDIKRYKYRSSLGWGDELSSYYSRNIFSNYTFGKLNSEEVKVAEILITKAYHSVYDLITILNLPYKINLQLLCNYDENRIKGDKDSDDDDSSNKKKRIFVPTRVLDSEELSEVEKINIICGLGLHEASHLLFTELKVISSFVELINTTEVKSVNKKILIDIVNLLEDSRVEDKLLTERPGFLNFIEECKSWNFKNFNKKFDNGDFKFLKTFYSYIRFPEFIDKEIYKDNLEFFQKIDKIFSSETPKNTKDSCVLSKKIFELLINEKGSLLPSSYDDSDVDSSKASQKSPAVDLLYMNLLYGLDGDSGEDPNGSLISKNLASSEILKKLVYGRAVRGSKDKAFFEKMKEKGNSKHLYNESVNRIKKYIPSVRNLIKNIDKNYKFNIYGCRNGLLDTNKLAEAYQGVPQVYVRQGKVSTNKLSVCILVDESGSMCGNDKYIKARDATILLNEALGSLPGIDLYIYGHSADEIGPDFDEVYIRIYKEKNLINKYSISSITHRDQNRDGDAILEVAKRVRKLTNEKCLMFVISDGEPCAGNYYGKKAMEDTRNKVLEAEKLGFDIVQISIDTVSKVGEMFDKYIDIKEYISELPKKLSNIVNKIIVKNKETTII